MDGWMRCGYARMHIGGGSTLLTLLTLPVCVSAIHVGMYSVCVYICRLGVVVWVWV